MSQVAFAVVTAGGSYAAAESPDVNTNTFIGQTWIFNLQAAAADTDAVIAISFDRTNIAMQLNLAHVKSATIPFCSKKVWVKKVSGASTCLVSITALGPVGGV